MKLEKKHWAMLGTGIVILVLVYWFFFRKKKSLKVHSESSYRALPLIGRGEQSSDPNLLMYGSESGYAMPRKSIPVVPGTLFKSSAKCACGSSNETGICVKNSGLLKCKESVITYPYETSSEVGYTREMGKVEAGAKTKKCPSGTVASDCWAPDGTMFKCCSTPNA